MAVWEAKRQAKNGNIISQVSWMDWTTQDVYYWLEHSFQYSANINTDDEMHWIKLSTNAEFTTHFAKSQLVSCGSNGVMALRVDWAAGKPLLFNSSTFSSGWTSKWDDPKPNTKVKVCPGVIFQDYFWYWATVDNVSALVRINNTWAWTAEVIQPVDHNDYTDEDISTPPAPAQAQKMNWTITAILNYNNTRLVVACDQDIWVYYPELDEWISTGYTYRWATGWKKVLSYEAWVTIIALTCTFEYLKVRAVDEWWNTKVYYYQGNNNLRSTFVYNVADLTGVRVTRVYSINGVDYYVSSQDWTDGFVNLYKMVWATPLPLFSQRSGLSQYDTNFKAPQFVWPCSISAGYIDWNFYVADCYGLYKFRYNPQGYDKGYMKWLLKRAVDYTGGSPDIIEPYGVCFNQGWLYVSTATGCWKMRVFDTWKNGYQDEWILISREFEGREWGTVTKMLDEIRMNYELNPRTLQNGTIDVYVSPNNLRESTNIDYNSNWWYKVMHIEQKNGKTRTEKSNLLNDLWANSGSSFKFDWQTITYAIVIKKGTQNEATPIVRQIDIKYHCKDKTNNVYDINEY